MITISNCSDFKLEDAWKRHKRGEGMQGLSEPSGHMLFFYAVECGLKHLLVRKNKMRNCPKSGKSLFYQHDLGRILREIEPSAAEVRQIPSNLRLTLGTGPLRHTDFSDVHLAWRYGLTIDPDEEKKILDWLRAVDRFITNRRTL
ncbi:MAG: hypothetical protein H7829_12525 [Magnetococcus sp. THC-1_WYH]